MKPTATAPPSREGSFLDREALLLVYEEVRSFSLRLCEPLETEDFVVQTMPSASPTKWHLAHTTWFFETFVLEAVEHGFTPFDPAFRVLFNSYYNSVGEQFDRARRGLLSRPGVAQVFAYRRDVDRRMASFLESADEHTVREMEETLVIGIHHEQQHQELILTDSKSVFAFNPLEPAYRPPLVPATPPSDPVRLSWLDYPGGLVEIGHEGPGFAYDNESPRHRVWLEPFALGNRLVTNSEFLEFIEDGGYRRPELWLAAGWATVEANDWVAPLYWRERDGERYALTLAGATAIDADEPVCHVSYFEADAYARWAGARLPSEAEWESVAVSLPVAGNFADTGRYHPDRASAGDEPVQMWGDVWEWTRSPYVEYPGYRAPDGALGEYNGKFMCNQMVLRGGSCASAASHLRATYRNFFEPEARWQFSGIRLASDR